MRNRIITVLTITLTLFSIKEFPTVINKINYEWEIYHTTVPVGTNPLQIPECKIKVYMIRTDTADTSRYQYSQNVVFVDSDDDYKLVELIAKYPVDVR